MTCLKELLFSLLAALTLNVVVNHGQIIMVNPIQAS